MSELNGGSKPPLLNGAGNERLLTTGVSNPRGVTVWLTGLPCSGKSTIAECLAENLRSRGRRVEVLDGDIVRVNLSQDLSFSPQDRNTNVLRIGFVAHLLSRNGVIVLVAAVSPYAAARRRVRERISDFVEVHVDCSVSECERRDVKGMYAKARAGEIRAFTGVDDPYEPPENPEVRLITHDEAPAESTRKVLRTLCDLGYLDAHGLGARRPDPQIPDTHSDAAPGSHAEASLT
jgi:adenylylsulfate kinase